MGRNKPESTDAEVEVDPDAPSAPIDPDGPQPGSAAAPTNAEDSDYPAEGRHDSQPVFPNPNVTGLHPSVGVNMDTPTAEDGEIEPSGDDADPEAEAVADAREEAAADGGEVQPSA